MPYQAKSKPKLKNNHLHVRKGDTVLVMAGKDKGKKGEILVAYPALNRIVVQGVNMVTKHQKPRGAQNPGGKQEFEAAIHASNVMLLCSKCGKATRNAHKFLENGDKVRVCKKCGETFEK